MSTLTVLAPLRIEARYARAGAPDAHVVVAGAGPRRASALTTPGHHPVAVVGVCGAVDPTLAPGDVIVAERVIGPGIDITLPNARVLAAELRRAGLPARAGTIASVAHIAGAETRAQLHAAGVHAVDMESAWLVSACTDRPVVVVRVVVDTPSHPLMSPLTVPRGMTALRNLRRALPTLSRWSEVIMPRRALLAEPRGFCAGVERAVTIVERAIDRYGPPVYVRRQIVHNRHVVDDLARKGAIFVKELDEVPPGGRVVLAAHGVAPEVRVQAVDRSLHTIDATCPLVAKVHAEVRRFAARGDTVLFIGHPDHEEVQGTVGEAPDDIVVIEHPDDIARADVPDPQRVAFVTQTTLAVDETREIVDRLLALFPAAEGPAKEDICYATQNRQDAVRALARECDLVLVVGSSNSSNSNRLVEVARREGCVAHLVDDDEDLQLSWLEGVERIGITAGASAPEAMVQRLLDALRGLGSLDVQTQVGIAEDVQFALPSEVR
ncbi:MAG: 4-hydroxy-3-methylbut-2-enyl diphosphate reductase [Actinobacteria bacterium]|nr:MAG: 4-hydroxy-3-methylbut-2-enyl diphosphate reductase [Actinomycetota bacterium]